MKKEQAFEIAKAELQDFVITEVIEYEKVFAIFFVNKEYAISEEFGDLLVGNGPLLIEKSTAKIFHTGSVIPLSQLIDAFNKYGSPYISYTNIVRLSIDGNYIKNIHDMLLLKNTLSLALNKAKYYYDQLLQIRSVDIELENINKVDDFLNKFQHQSVRAEQVCQPIRSIK